MASTEDFSGGPDEVVSKLRAALEADGDFPVRARVVWELRKLAGDPNTSVDKIVELILSEPSLAPRLLHLVNSVVYQRRNPIMTVSQAVMLLGMNALADLCTGLVLLRRFSPAAQRGGIFADSVKKSVLTSILTSALAEDVGGESREQGYLAGTFYTMGPLLLAFYFPQLFLSAEERAKRRKQTITQSISEMLGIAPVALSVGIVDALGIPDFYSGVLTEASSLLAAGGGELPESPLAPCLAAAGSLADAIVDTHTRQELRAAIEPIGPRFGIADERLYTVLDRVPQSFKHQCDTIDMAFLALPEHFVSYLETRLEEEPESAAAPASGDDRFTYYVDEIKQAIHNQETVSSVVTSVMEALAFGLKFDRVLLLFSDPSQTKLMGKMSLGASLGRAPQEIVRPLQGRQAEDSPEAIAFHEGVVETFGEPLFEDGWPFAAIPIGSSDNALGVIYADKLSSAAGQSASPLAEGTQLALGLIAELLEQAVDLNG